MCLPHGDEYIQQDEDILHCFCRKPDDGREYLICEGDCKGWFHVSCVGLEHLTKQELNALTYICPSCQLSELKQKLSKKDTIIDGLENQIKTERSKQSTKIESHVSEIRAKNNDLTVEIARLK